MEDRLRILFVSSEVTPFARTGGLGDVIGALPPVVAEQGHDVRIVMPLYPSVLDQACLLTLVVDDLFVPLAFGDRSVRVWQGHLPQSDTGAAVPVYFIEQDAYFARSGLYGDAHGEYPDNAQRFIFFCRATLALVERLQWVPHVFHCQDWHASLIPAYLRFLPGFDARLTEAVSVFTIHNLAHQGIFSSSAFALTGLPSQLFQPAGLEFHQQVNFMKAGLYYADALTTVSPTYAEEICTPEFGYGLDGVLRERREALVGIVNGVDYTVWNPAVDAALAARFSVDDVSGKRACKTALLRQFGLVDDVESPLLGMVTRLAEQKGIDLVMAGLERLFAFNTNVVILGSGERRDEELLIQAARRYPDRLGVRIGFNDTLSHQIQAGIDCLLMPSRFEPCGLTQMYAMRYGAIPIARATGGLRDTVTPFDPVTRQGTGFVFEEATAEALLTAVQAAVAMFADKALWRQLQRNAMTQDFSWDRSAQEYVALYRQTLERKSGSA